MVLTSGNITSLLTFVSEITILSTIERISPTVLVIKFIPSSSDISTTITLSCISEILLVLPFLKDITAASPIEPSILLLISYSSLSSFLLKSEPIIFIQFSSEQTLYRFNFSALVITNCIKKFLYTFCVLVKSPFSSGNKVLLNIFLVDLACSIPL